MAVTNWHDFRMDDSDEEFANSEEDRFSGKVALLIVIDATPSMFTTDWEDNDETPFLAAIKGCEAILKSKIVSNPRDVVSILLNGTESKNANFPNIYKLQEFSTVTVKMIQELIEMRNSPDLNDFANKIGSSEEYNLKDLFWQAKMDFETAKTQSFTKKLMYFTREDNPHGNKPNLQADIVSKFMDLGNIELNIMSFKRDFEFCKFYSKLVNDDNAVVYCKNLDSLTKIVRMKQRLRRPITRSTLEIAPGMKVGIGFYSFVRRAIPPRAVNINKRNNERVDRTINVFRSDTGMPVLKSEERKMVNIQGESAVFTAQEMKEIKLVGEPGVKILGFISARDFDNLIWFRSPGYFLYPDEERIAGSKDLFTTLLKRCHALEKVAVVRYVLTRGKGPKLGVLIPSVPDENSKATFPQGFHIFPVPFSDEVRKYENMEAGTEAPPELVALMEKVVKRLTNTTFDILEVKNPALQNLFRKLEEEALEERVDDREEQFDFTEPNEELMLARLKNIPDEIEENATEASHSFSKPRSSALVRKPRIDIEMEARHGRLLNCTCTQIREFLVSRGVEVPYISGKRYLIELVSKCLGFETFA